MARARTTKPEQPDSDTPEYLASWAAKLAKATHTAELERLVGVYRQIAGNDRLSAADRTAARRRAQALRKILKQSC